MLCIYTVSDYMVADHAVSSYTWLYYLLNVQTR